MKRFISGVLGLVMFVITVVVAKEAYNINMSYYNMKIIDMTIGDKRYYELLSTGSVVAVIACLVVAICLVVYALSSDR